MLIHFENKIICDQRTNALPLHTQYPGYVAWLNASFQIKYNLSVFKVQDWL